MKELLPLTSGQLATAEERLRDPPPGGRIEAARNWGIDLSLLIEQLRLKPDQRARKLESASEAVEEIRGAARRRR